MIETLKNLVLGDGVPFPHVGSYFEEIELSGLTPEYFWQFDVRVWNMVSMNYRVAKE